jgi:hypothetical protein
MSKLFRGGALSDTALLAREAIQNSTDAAERFGKVHRNVPFRVVFRFVHLFGDQKAAAIEALDLRGMAAHRAEYPTDPLQPGSVLDTLDDRRTPLQLLYVEDYGTHGLYGDPSTFKNSHLFMAMYYIGASTKGADEGGLYGFGKSALQRDALRLAETCNYAEIPAALQPRGASSSDLDQGDRSGPCRSCRPGS